MQQQRHARTCVRRLRNWVLGSYGRFGRLRRVWGVGWLAGGGDAIIHYYRQRKAVLSKWASHQYWFSRMLWCCFVLVVSTSTIRACRGKLHLGPLESHDNVPQGLVWPEGLVAAAAAPLAAGNTAAAATAASSSTGLCSKSHVRQRTAFRRASGGRMQLPFGHPAAGGRLDHLLLLLRSKFCRLRRACASFKSQSVS